MTPHAQNIAIAELRGFTVINDTLCDPRQLPDGDIDLNPIAPVPDYTRDLNAVADAEVLIIRAGHIAIRDYEDHLQKFVANIVFANAAQKAQSILRVLNKWDPTL